MDWFVKAFIKASVAWLSLGITFGLAMALRPAWILYRPVHLHMNLLGFVAMMIFGVAYHVMPRFTGHPLRSPALAAAHWWMANTGLVLMVVGFLLRPHAAIGVLLIAGGGVLSVAGGYAFAYNIWRTLDGAPSSTMSAPAQLRVSRGSLRARGG